MIWNHSLTDIIKGYSEKDDSMTCIICGKSYEKGRIIKIDDNLYDAFGAVKKHISKEHGSITSYLLQQEANLTGISEIQRQILKLIYDGKSDKNISEEIGIAPSTVRNHRFKLREKEKQARLFLALMNGLEEETSHKIEKSDKGIIEEIHMSATMVDERFDITDKEREEAIATFMDEKGALKQIPARAKKKIIILREIMKNFKKDIEYSEQEVNRVLKRIYEVDYVGLRRALIEYGFMDRSADCTVYRVKE